MVRFARFRSVAATWRSVALVVGACALAACVAAPKVSTDFEPGWDFGAYRSFAFVSDRPLLVGVVVPVNPAFEKQLMNATRTTLEARGYVFRDRREADFAVGFVMGTRANLRENNFPDAEEGTSQGGWTWGGPRYENRDVRDTTEGLLSIDIFDVRQRRSVWHGWTTQEISDSDRMNPAETLNVIVRNILAQFPPP